MFTPPSSPDPRRTRPPVEYQKQHSNDRNVFLLAPPAPALPNYTPQSIDEKTPPSHPPAPEPAHGLPDHEQADARLAHKKRIGRQMRWAVVLVPALLIFITLSTHWLAHPAALDVLAPTATTNEGAEVGWDWERWRATVSDWSVHKRHPQASGQDPTPSSPPTALSLATQPTSSASASSLPSPSSANSTATSVSTGVPTVPATAPVLPTPFPQPFSTLSQNFSTQQCENFFTNMSQLESFRECRSFAMLLSSSQEFIQQAQSNLTELNIVVWGTCNTPLSEQECTQNMDGFATSLQQACTQEISEQNALVEQTLLGLQSYDILRQAGCLVDNTTDAYCYVEAVASTVTSDQYFYSLPLGLGLPPSTTLSCSNCSRMVMDTYVANGSGVPGLGETYASAAQVVDGACGADFVAQGDFGAQPTSGALRNVGVVWSMVLCAVAVVLSLP